MAPFPTLDQPAEPKQPARQRRQHGRLDEGKRALARQHETDPGSAGEVEEGGDHQRAVMVGPDPTLSERKLFSA
jgi:hypothetical protein